MGSMRKTERGAAGDSSAEMTTIGMGARTKAAARDCKPRSRSLKRATRDAIAYANNKKSP